MKYNREEYKKACDLYISNYNSLPEEERKRLADLFSRLSEIRSFMMKQCEIYTDLKIRHEELAQKVIEWYRENNTSKNEQNV